MQWYVNHGKIVLLQLSCRLNGRTTDVYRRSEKLKLKQHPKRLKPTTHGALHSLWCVVSSQRMACSQVFRLWVKITSDSLYNQKNDLHGTSVRYIRAYPYLRINR